MRSISRVIFHQIRARPGLVIPEPIINIAARLYKHWRASSAIFA
jgi:hypothetical protein